jgi:hypothetical protein
MIHDFIIAINNHLNYYSYYIQNTKKYLFYL